MKKTETKQTKKHAMISVQNADGIKDTDATILIQNKIDYIPKVSVIIPVYNVEQYLRECLDSIVNQTLHDIEIICVDDGSTDNSLEILKEYAKKDNRITVISRENKGVGFSRNQGINYAKGEFIAFMDPDDWYPSEEVLSRLYASAQKHKVQICGGTSLIVYDESRQEETKKEDFFNRFPKEQLCNYSDFQYDYGYTLFIYNRNMIIKNEVFFPDYKRFQDPPFMVKAFSCAKQFYITKDCVYAYRRSHKEINWTEEKVYGLISGLRDNLVVATHNDLDRLYNTTLNRINKEYKSIITLQSSDRINKIKQEIMSTCLKHAHDRYKKDSTKYKVSVVLPIYNAGSYLRECLDSVTKQTLKNIEIICVNDGSTDNSLNIIKEYADKDKRIKYIDKPNAGYGQTMNCGIDLACGEYIGIVEPDDFIKPDMYETLYNKAKELDLDVIKADYCEFTGENKQYRYTNKKVFNAPESFYNRVLTPEKDEKILYIFAINPAGIFKHSFLDKYKIRHNETPGAAYQDNGFWAQTTYLADKVYFMNCVFYCYRQDNPNQSIKKKNNVWTIPNEYHFIDNIFAKHKKVDKLLPVYFLRKFNAYIYHMIARLDVEYWPEYLTAIGKEFKQHKKHGDIDKKYFNNNQWSDLQMIMNNPNEYIEKNKILQSNNNESYDVKVSVIIPVYNTEKYLEKCLDSVINQTEKNIEIICVNDGSTDNSLNIIKKYADKDSRIKVIDNRVNRKQGTARNQALNIAKGHYIQFVDSDDYLQLNAIEKLYTYANKNNLDMLMFSGRNFKDGTDIMEPNKLWDFNYLPQNWNKTVFSFKDCLDFAHLMAVSTCLTIYKHSFIEKNNLQFPEELFFEDNVFFVKGLTKASACGILNEKLYCRRLHPKSTTQTRNHHFVDFLKITDILLGYLKQCKINKKTFNNYVNSYLGILVNDFVKLDQTDKKLYIKDMKHLLKRYDKSKLAFLYKDNHVKSYVLFPYYLLATVWMNVVSLPLAKFRRHIKQVMYSHSTRSSIDKLEKHINELNLQLNLQLDCINKQHEISMKNMQDFFINVQHKFSLLNMEPYWANVYHDTILNSVWLKDKSVSPGRWAVSYIVLYVLFRILDEIKPQSILECGLGQSSKLTIQYADAYKAKLMICENNQDWLSFFKLQFPTADKYTKILDTEMVHIVPEHESRTYKGFESVIKGKKFNLVMIDGPLGSAHYSRPEILDIVDNLDKSFVILLDDMNRIGEQETWSMLKSKLTEKNILFKEAIYKSDKQLGLLCSSDLSWLTTL